MTIERPKQKTWEGMTGDRWVLPTDIELVRAAEDEFARRLTNNGWEDSDLIKMCFREALINAIVHGNLGVVKSEDGPTLLELALEKQKAEPTDKKVYIDLDIAPKKISITIRDEGKGFDWKSLPDPTSPEEVTKLQTKGRGVFLMRQIFNSVVYNESGNEVTMTKLKGKT